MKDSTTAKHAAVRGVDYGTHPLGFDARAFADKWVELERNRGPHFHLQLTPEEEAETSFEASLDEELAKVRELLLEKNAAYGDSALNPVNALSTASATEQIRVRMDDKLSRMVRGHEYANEDTLLDFVGYYFLLKIAEGRA